MWLYHDDEKDFRVIAHTSQQIGGALGIAVLSAAAASATDEPAEAEGVPLLEAA